MVAVEAILPHRRVLPNKWPAFLRVAGVTDLVYGISAQQRIGRRSVRRVTVHAAHFALEQWHVRALAKLGPLLGVATEAGVTDARLSEQSAGRGLGHWIVAVAASEVLPLVRRTLPVQKGTRPVTAEAHLIHLLDARAGLACKTDDGAGIFGIRQMGGAGTVARLARPSRPRPSTFMLERPPVNSRRPVLRLYGVTTEANRFTEELGLRWSGLGFGLCLPLRGEAKQARGENQQPVDTDLSGARPSPLFPVVRCPHACRRSDPPARAPIICAFCCRE